jgi:hypothetical protein
MIVSYSYPLGRSWHAASVEVCVIRILSVGRVSRWNTTVSGSEFHRISSNFIEFLRLPLFLQNSFGIWIRFQIWCYHLYSSRFTLSYPTRPVEGHPHFAPVYRSFLLTFVGRNLIIHSCRFLLLKYSPPPWKYSELYLDFTFIWWWNLRLWSSAVPTFLRNCCLHIQGRSWRQ